MWDNIDKVLLKLLDTQQQQQTNSKTVGDWNF